MSERRRQLEVGLELARAKLARRMASPERDVEQDAALALAYLALLSASESNSAESSEPLFDVAESIDESRPKLRVFSPEPRRVSSRRAYDDAPIAINFERAKAELLARRVRPCAAPSVAAPTPSGTARPRLRLFCGE